MTKPTNTDIQDAFEKVIYDALTNGEAIKDDEGNLVRLTPSSSLLAVVRAYLKDNPTPMPLPVPQSTSKMLQDKAAVLPFASKAS